MLIQVLSYYLHQVDVFLLKKPVRLSSNAPVDKYRLGYDKTLYMSS